MPTPIAHTAVSIALYKTIIKDGKGFKIFFWSVFCGIIADLDLIGYFLNVPVENFWGHRGFTHSIFFSGFLAFFVCFAFFRQHNIKDKNFWFLFFNFCLIGALHSFLDALTSRYYGTALFLPFSNHRFVFFGSPINDNIGANDFWGYYSTCGLNLIVVEGAIIILALLWLWLINRRGRNCFAKK
ncbi:MAG TPA: metal-dependent hydrolase [bacterium]|nr:metal-dependent hydrolase [bacterium]